MTAREKLIAAATEPNPENEYGRKCRALRLQFDEMGPALSLGMELPWLDRAARIVQIDREKQELVMIFEPEFFTVDARTMKETRHTDDMNGNVTSEPVP